MDVNIIWEHGNVNEWSVECVVSEMSGEWKVNVSSDNRCDTE